MIREGDVLQLEFAQGPHYVIAMWDLPSGNTVMVMDENHEVCVYEKHCLKLVPRTEENKALITEVYLRIGYVVDERKFVKSWTTKR